ncbi:phage major capsid protein [Nocardioides luteus]|uniref:phage major capsid protein n=1 Tax=Nocardioides luteus TaxID=1844 RepID=UPI0018C94568|nr:phage major capsid protein [Nocardioides luteus]MBG6095958.1 HK97 family phage major capsid protein [Nocardioides luteus]
MTDEERLAAIADEAQKIIDLAKQNDGDVSEAQAKRLEDLANEGEAIKARIDKRTKSKRTAEALDRLGKGATLGPDGLPVTGLFNQKQTNDLIRAVRSKTAIRLDTSLSSAHFKAAAKAAHTAGSLNLPGVGSDVVTAPEGRAVVAIRDFMEVTNNAPSNVRWYSLANPSDTAVAIVAEGGLKPEADLVPTPHDDPLIKIATRFGFTDELIEDSSFMATAIQNTLLRAVMVRENRYILDTVAATSGIITATTTADGLIDALSLNIANSVSLNGEAPSVLLMNPAQVAAIQQAKASTSGVYISDPLGPGPTAVHGVPVAASPAVAAGTVYILTPGWGRFYTRGNGALQVDVGLASGDFENNRTSVRVEERVLATVPQPTHVTRLTVA